MSSSYENDVNCPSTPPHSSRRKNIVYISSRKYFFRFYMIAAFGFASSCNFHVQVANIYFPLLI